MPFKCSYCGQIFCEDHRLPENHMCPNLPKERSWKQYEIHQNETGTFGGWLNNDDIVVGGEFWVVYDSTIGFEITALTVTARAPSRIPDGFFTTLFVPDGSSPPEAKRTRCPSAERPNDQLFWLLC